MVRRRSNGLHGADLLAYIESQGVRTENGCLEWPGAKDAANYGKINYMNKNQKVSRLVTALRHGPFPDCLEVLHSCDNPPCYADEHLHLGTHSLNMIERTERGRDNLQRGDQHYMRRRNKDRPNG